MAKKLTNTEIKLGTGTLLKEAVNDVGIDYSEIDNKPSTFTPPITKYNLHLLNASGQDEIGAYKIGNLVILYGMIRNITNEEIFTIPSEIRPSSIIYIRTTSFHQLQISNWGSVYVWGAPSQISLNGIVYIV